MELFAFGTKWLLYWVILLLAYIPVVHMDYRSMEKSGRCKRECIDACHPPSRNELKLVEVVKEKMKKCRIY